MTEQTAHQSRDRVKVAILGGGCGGLAAAWALTDSAELRERYRVTVYQLGWQLGGKGASGRMPHPGNGRGSGQRIEEHGLHIWFGFYAHAFRMLKQAYAEAGLADGEKWWNVPFEKCHSVSLYERGDDDAWVRQAIDLSPRGGLDRGPPTEPRGTPLSRVIARTTRLLLVSVRAELSPIAATRGGAPAERRDPELANAVSVLDELAEAIDRLGSPLTLDPDDTQDYVTRGAMHLGGVATPGIGRATLEPLVSRLLQCIGNLRVSLSRREHTARLRFWRGVLELAAAALVGVVRDDVLTRGFGVLDDEDLREWLGRHGASEDTLARSPVLRGLYDLTFAYSAGDKCRPNLAAGKGLQSLLMMMNYEGAFMWRMRAGMGDVVFAPLYLALKRRGVEFQFFSRVTRLRLSPGRPIVNAIELTREASVRKGANRYAPLKRIGEWWCWPASPDYDQLERSVPQAQTLERGSDFDDVVLAVPVAALHEPCQELALANPRFKQMLDGAATVRTNALQVWLTKPIDALRQRAGPDPLDPPATGYVEPFDTYCDMSHLLDAEAYGGHDAPSGVAYFCGVLPDSIDLSDGGKAIRARAIAYLERHAHVLWPAAFADARFDWRVTFDPLHRSGSDRIAAQYFSVNSEPTDRYVTTPAGSVASRLEPGQSGFENLVLAGDWTHNGIDGGCVEAAVISGERAAGEVHVRRSRSRPGKKRLNLYVEYGALATAPGPLLCERARLYCFFVKSDRKRLQQLCDRVFKEPTGGALRFRVPRLAPVVLTFGTIAGLRSLHPGHSGRGSASEPEAAIWVPTLAQHFEGGQYVDDHLAVFMPYIWVDDPIAFASGREVYGFDKTQGWIRPLGDPRSDGDGFGVPPDPPGTLGLDVHGAVEYRDGTELARHRLLTVERSDRARRKLAINVDEGTSTAVEGVDLPALLEHCLSELDPDAQVSIDMTPRRSRRPALRLAGAASRVGVLSDLVSERAVRHVFLKQIRDAEDGELACIQQVVEARSTVTPGSLRWRRLRGTYDLSVSPLATHPLEDELGLELNQTIRLAFAAEFGFRMEAGEVCWP